MLWRYAITRLLTLRVGMLILLVFTASAITSSDRTLFEMTVTGSMLVLLIFQFRFWDDLADVSFDREYFPQRILAQCEHHQMFYPVVLLLAAASGGVIFVWRAEWQTLVYLLLLASFVFLYRIFASREVHRVIRTHLVLLKYPAFIFVAPTTGNLYFAACIAASVYFCLTIFDLLSDPALAHFNARHWIISSEVILMLLLLGALLWTP